MEDSGHDSSGPVGILSPGRLLEFCHLFTLPSFLLYASCHSLSLSLSLHTTPLNFPFPFSLSFSHPLPATPPSPLLRHPYFVLAFVIPPCLQGSFLQGLIREDVVSLPPFLPIPPLPSPASPPQLSGNCLLISSGPQTAAVLC